MKNKRIGFTTSLPVEVILAAGHTPIDLNNIFITGSPQTDVSDAEMIGFPRTTCAWIKGNYRAALKAELDEVVGIVQGDCANGQSLLSMLSEENLLVTHFSFPLERTRQALDNEIRKFERHFGVSREQTEQMKHRLDRIRKKLITIDTMTWEDQKVTGKENHYWQVNASDFKGDPDLFESELDQFIDEASLRDPYNIRLRLAYLGVPPIYSDLYDVIHQLGGEVIFNEVQRQFAMPNLEPDIVSQYLVYTYPYSVIDRLADIRPQIKLRAIDGIISYTQSFCHMQIDNLILKKHINLPFLTLEGDKPEPIDSRTLLRIESFMEVHS